MDITETVNVNGFEIPAQISDNFFSGRDGSTISDEDWDISRDRAQATHNRDDLEALHFTYIGEEFPLEEHHG